MKNNYAILVALFIVATTFAQAPEKMSYQAIVRDATGNLVTSQSVRMQISILQTTASGTAVYVETQTPTTNINGLATLEIGAGTPVTGTFAGIDWSTGTYFIKTETDLTGGTNYSITGTSQLLSVPYALHAKIADNTFSGDYNDLTNKPIAPTYTVNTFYSELGGYVIEISSDGTHGLVVAMQDQGISNFYESNDLLSNDLNHDTNGAEFKDWRLPTKRELNLMYDVYDSGNGATLNSYYYWSSMSYDPRPIFEAWFQNFSDDGTQSNGGKSATFYVRAVRAF